MSSNSISPRFYPNFDLAVYFGVESNADVPWGHAINSREKLEVALKSGDIMLAEKLTLIVASVEADICVATSDPSKIIMTHPPIREGDFTFSQWVQTVLDHCTNNPKQKVGIKLDFKDPPALRPCLAELAALHLENRLNIPLWVNADILNATSTKVSPFDPEDFVQAIQSILPGIVASLGWTTDAHTPYTDENITHILEICDKHQMKNVTFPMRASICRDSEGALRRLLEADPTYSLTVWSGPEKFKRTHYDWVRRSFDAKKIYLDVTVIPDDQFFISQ